MPDQKVDGYWKIADRSLAELHAQEHAAKLLGRERASNTPRLGVVRELRARVDHRGHEIRRLFRAGVEERLLESARTERA
jgi:hypothetical protein